MDQATTRCGLFHSAYSNSYVNLAVFDMATREMVDVVGAPAEQLVHLFCVIDRHHTVTEQLVPGLLAGDARSLRHFETGEPLPVKATRGDEKILAPVADLVRLLIFTIADVAEQHHSWQDELMNGMYFEGQNVGIEKHQPMALWPGDGRPGLWMSFTSRVAKAARVATERMRTSRVSLPEINLPSIFDGCTSLIGEDDEEAARDLYWSVATADPASLQGDGLDDAIARLELAISINPFVGELHQLKAQLHLVKAGHASERPRQLEKAEEAASRAIELLCQWGCAWDKRAPWEGHLSWSRVLLERAEEGKPWPTNSWEIISFGIVKEADR